MFLEIYFNRYYREEDKEKPPPTTPVSERPTRPPELLRSHPFVTRIETFPYYVYRIYNAQTGNRVRLYSKFKIQGPCENEYKKYCSNGGKCYYLVDEDIAGCNCTWLYGGKRCEKYMWWD